MSCRSLPSRGRGSKPFLGHQPAAHGDVAPLAGAWIETAARPTKTISSTCRSPRGGVDRNQPSITWRSSMRPSLPSRGRGSKPCSRAHPTRCDWSLPSRGRGSKPTSTARRRWPTAVAPLAGAWIETVDCIIGAHGILSLPSRGRGSKLPEECEGIVAWVSLLSRGRGSKQLPARWYRRFVVVARQAVAWIEPTRTRRREKE